MGLSASDGASMGLSTSAGPDVLCHEFREFVEFSEGKGMKPHDLAVGFRSLAVVHRFEFG